MWLNQYKYSKTTGSLIGSLSIAPHIVGMVRPTSTTSVLVGDKTDDTIRTFTIGTTSIGTIAVTPSVAAETFYEVTTATLNIDQAWLIHPAQPALSVSVDAGPNAWRDVGLNVDIASSQQTTAQSAVTLHNPVGRTRTVAIATGNRYEPEWQFVLLAPTLDDRDDVTAILRDQTPLLLRSPDSFGWDLPDGYYAIGDVSYDRVTPALQQPYRRITLPLTPSDPPVVRVATDRTWNTVVEQNDTWADVPLRYGTWDDLVLGIS